MQSTKLLPQKIGKEWINGKYAASNIHPLVCVRTKHGDILCDQGIARAIELFNSIDGIETEWSCQGDEVVPAYVIFSGRSSYRLAIFITRYIFRRWFTSFFSTFQTRFISPHIEIETQLDATGFHYVRFYFIFSPMEIRKVELVLHHFIRVFRPDENPT